MMDGMMSMWLIGLLVLVGFGVGDCGVRKVPRIVES